MNSKLLYLTLSLGLFTGCDDFLDVQPVGKLIPTQVEEFENILNNPKIVENYYFVNNNGGSFLGNLGDNVYISENSATYDYTNLHPALDRYAAYTFKQPYMDPLNPDYFWDMGIYYSAGLFNNVIEGVNSVDGKSEYSKQIIAQATAGRAWGYLTAGLLYGPMYDPNGANDTKTIPYRLAGDPTVGNPGLSTTAELFDQVWEDIAYALENAPENVANPCRFNKAAVQALAAYYYMFKRDWENMYKYADMAWNSSLKNNGKVDNMIYNMKDFYYRQDSQAHPHEGTDAEVELELLGPDNLLIQTTNREILMYRKAPNGLADYPSEEFLGLFDQDKDLRYKLFALKALGFSQKVGNEMVDDGVVTKYYRGNKTLMTEGFSHPELLLMRAEAAARLGKKSQALADLNLLRKYRYDATKGSTDLANGSAMSDDELLNEVLTERRRELPSASFQRVLDLKRYILDAGKPWCKQTIEHKVGDKTFSGAVNSDLFILPVGNFAIRYNPQWGLQMDERPWNPKG